MAVALSMVLQPACPSVIGVQNRDREVHQASKQALQSLETREQSELPNDSQQMGFQLRDGFLIVVDGRIASLSHLKFILDTGSTHSMVDSKIADRLGLARQSEAVLNFDRYAKIDWTKVPEIQFGPLEARNVRMMVGALDQFSEFTNGIDAVIGLDLLRQTRKLGVDFERKLLIFTESRDTPYVAGAPPRALTVLLEVQSSQLRLIVDTGLGEMVVFSDRLHAHAPHVKLLGEERVHEARIPGRTAALPGIQLIPDSQAPVFLLDRAPQSLPEDIDGFLGLKPLLVDFAEIDFRSETLKLCGPGRRQTLLARDAKTSNWVPEQESSGEHNYAFRLERGASRHDRERSKEK